MHRSRATYSCICDAPSRSEVDPEDGSASTRFYTKNVLLEILRLTHAPLTGTEAKEWIAGAVITFSFPVSQALLFAILQACSGLHQHLTHAPANKSTYYGGTQGSLLTYMRDLKSPKILQA